MTFPALATMPDRDTDLGHLARSGNVDGGDRDGLSIHQRIAVQSMRVDKTNNTLEVMGAEGRVQIFLTFGEKDVIATMLDAINTATATVGAAASTDIDSSAKTGKRKQPSTGAILMGESQKKIQKLATSDVQAVAPKSNAMAVPRRVSLTSSSASSEKQVFRLVLFREKNGDDIHGRGPGLYALKHNCVFEKHFFQNEHRFQQGKRAFAEKFLGQIQSGEKKGVSKSLWNKQNQFATMPKGSIVCMVLNNSPGYQDVCFGTIQNDNDFRILGRADLEGLPVASDHGGLEDTFLYHRVKWVCHTKMKSLPGREVNAQGTPFVPWLNHSSPFSIVELKKASDHMKSNEFKDCISKDFTDLLEEADQMLAM